MISSLLRAGLAVGLVALPLGCGPTDECKRLDEIAKQHDKVLLNAKARAYARAQAKKQADVAEAAMTKVLEESGIEQPEAVTTAELTRRVGLVPTATISRREVQLSSTDEGDPIATTEWKIEFRERDLTKAWDKVVTLGTVPPLLTLATVTLDKGTDRWTLQLQRMLPVTSPYQAAPVPLPALEDPGAVPSQIGFCGASELRAKIGATRTEIAALKEDAEAVTVLIAAGPTFEGVRRRATTASRTERDARAIMSQVMDGMVREKLPFKAIGYEDPSVIVEVWGGPKEVRALDTLLLPFGDRVKVSELGQAGVVRRAVVVKQAKKETAPVGDSHGHEGHGH